MNTSSELRTKVTSRFFALIWSLSSSVKFKSFTIAEKISSTFSGSNKKPLILSSTIYGFSNRFAQITGKPHDIASTTTFGYPS